MRVWCCLFPEFSTGKRFSLSFDLTRLWLLLFKPSFFPRSCFLMWPRLLPVWGWSSCYCVTLSHLAWQTSTFGLCRVCSVAERKSKCIRIGLGETQRPLWSPSSAIDLQVDCHVRVHLFWDRMAHKCSFKADTSKRNIISTVFVVFLECWSFLCLLFPFSHLKVPSCTWICMHSSILRLRLFYSHSA